MKWHYSSSAIVRELLGTTETNYLPQLLKKRYVRAVPAPSLLCGKIWMLSQDGLAAATQAAGIEISYDLRPESISHANVKHTLAAQRAILGLRAQNIVHEFHPERLIGRPDLRGQKRPDVECVNVERNVKIAVEVELSPKFGRELDMSLIAIVEGLRLQIFDCAIYVSPHQATLDRYRQAINVDIPEWWKPETPNKWIRSNRSITLSDTERSRIYFVHRPDLLLGLEQLG